MTITALGPTLHTTVANLAFAAGVTLLGAAGSEWGVGAGLLVKQVGCGRQAVRSPSLLLLRVGHDHDVALALPHQLDGIAYVVGVSEVLDAGPAQQHLVSGLG